MNDLNAILNSPAESRAIYEALARHERGLPLTSIQAMIVAYHPRGTAAGCVSCGR